MARLTPLCVDMVREQHAAAIRLARAANLDGRHQEALTLYLPIAADCRRELRRLTSTEAERHALRLLSALRKESAAGRSGGAAMGDIAYELHQLGVITTWDATFATVRADLAQAAQQTRRAA